MPNYSRNIGSRVKVAPNSLIQVDGKTYRVIDSKELHTRNAKGFRFYLTISLVV